MWSASFLPIWTMWALALLMEMGPRWGDFVFGGWGGGVISISRANVHMVHMGRKLALHNTL